MKTIKHWAMLISSLSIFVFFIIGCGKQTNPHLKRGDDWIKLQDSA
jgi:hypothetical protein